jgi:hypothetical protein
MSQVCSVTHLSGLDGDGSGRAIHPITPLDLGLFTVRRTASQGLTMIGKLLGHTGHETSLAPSRETERPLRVSKPGDAALGQDVCFGPKSGTPSSMARTVRW